MPVSADFPQWHIPKHSLYSAEEGRVNVRHAVIKMCYRDSQEIPCKDMFLPNRKAQLFWKLQQFHSCFLLLKKKAVAREGLTHHSGG